jgi:ubiquinone/menaquinone biosynthesis C-methylase UbiE
MSAHYDTYDYPAYWIGREYEHGCEFIAIRAFLAKIPKVKTILEIGAGFGRLLPAYSFRGKRIILSDPSKKLLSIAKEGTPNKNIKIVYSNLTNLPKKVRPGSVDLAIMVRVLHHIENIDQAVSTVYRLLDDGGYFILEFANKGHFKATVSQMLKGNLVFPMDLDTLDKRSKRNVRKGTIPFQNFHPDVILEKLYEYGFTVIEKRSVSNFRGETLKQFFPIKFLLSLSAFFQLPLGFINFGPSIFILARKKG